MRTPTFADVEDAADRLKGWAVETPLLRADALDAACGSRVFVKAECLQRTGSFKFRGAYNRISRLDAAERRAGVVAYSSGNHAQGVAAAARLVQAPATIVMPSDTPAVKVDATRAMGARVVPYDRFTEDREAIARGIADDRGATLVPPYEDPFVVAGQGTLGREAARQLEQAGAQADVLYAPASGGGLLAGVGLVFAALSPATEVRSAEPEGFDDHAKSAAVKARVTNAPGARSLCDALLSPTPGEMTWSINENQLAGGAAVSDAEALAAMAVAFRTLKIVLEPGGAVALAAALQGGEAVRGKTVLVIASGGNVDPEVFSRAIAA